MSVWFFVSAPLFAQDSVDTAPAKSSGQKTRKRAHTKEKTGADQDKAAQPNDSEKTEAAAKTKAGSTDEAKNKGEAKKEVPAPPPPSPKLIEVPQDDATYTPRPKVVAVFVFTNGDRIESDDYLITKDAVFINKNGQKTRYPINTVDRDATKAANGARGVDIIFPKSKSEFNLDF